VAPQARLKNGLLGGSFGLCQLDPGAPAPSSGASKNAPSRGGSRQPPGLAKCSWGQARAVVGLLGHHLCGRVLLFAFKIFLCGRTLLRPGYGALQRRAGGVLLLARRRRTGARCCALAAALCRGRPKGGAPAAVARPWPLRKFGLLRRC
jgi:hypothetical protein